MKLKIEKINQPGTIILSGGHIYNSGKEISFKNLKEGDEIIPEIKGANVITSYTLVKKETKEKSQNAFKTVEGKITVLSGDIIQLEGSPMIYGIQKGITIDAKEHDKIQLEINNKNLVVGYVILSSVQEEVKETPAEEKQDTTTIKKLVGATKEDTNKIKDEIKKEIRDTNKNEINFNSLALDNYNKIEDKAYRIITEVIGHTPRDVGELNAWKTLFIAIKERKRINDTSKSNLSIEEIGNIYLILYKKCYDHVKKLAHPYFEDPHFIMVNNMFIELKNKIK